MKNANVNYFVSMNHVYHMFHVPYIFVLTTAGPPLTDDKCMYAFAKICPKGVTNLFVSVSVAADEVPRVLDGDGIHQRCSRHADAVVFCMMLQFARY